MCAMATLTKDRVYKQSIIKIVDPNDDSLESDYNSDNELDHHNSSLHNDASTQTITSSCQLGCIGTQINCINNDKASSEKPYRRSTQDICTPSPRTAGGFLRINPEPCRLPSPALYRRGNEQYQIPIGARRSRSAETLSFSALKKQPTGDSGTGESVERLPQVTSIQPIHYERVPIYGQNITAIMANRFEFDQSKIDEYRRQKWKTSVQPPFFKPPPSVSSILSVTPKTKKQNVKNNPSTTKSNSLLSRVIRVFKPVPTNHKPNEPIMYRHHHASHREEENH